MAMRRFVSIGLSLILGFGPVLASVPQPAAAAEPQPEPVKIVREVLDMGTEDSKVFELSNGAYLSEVYPGPVRTEIATDVFVPVDTSLIAEEPGVIKTVASPVDVRFALADAVAPVTVSQDGVEARIALVGAAAVAPIGLGDTATYTDVFPSTDLVYECAPSGVKETIVLDGPGAPSKFTLDVDISGGDLVGLPGGATVIAASGESTPTLAVGELKVFDAAGVACEQATTHVATRGDGAYAFTYEVPRAWLEAPDRVWPVSVDPELATDADTWVNESAASTNYGNDTNLHIGRQTGGSSDDRRAYMRFDASGYGGGYISTATLQVYANYVQTSSRTYLGKTSTYWNPGTVTWNSGVNFSAISSQILSAAGWSYWDVTSMVQEWARPLNPLSWGTYTPMLYQDESGGQGATHYKRFNSVNNASYKPKIMLYWDAPFTTSGTPKTSYVSDGADAVTATVDVMTSYVGDVRSLEMKVNGASSDITRHRANMGWFKTDPGTGWISQPAAGGGYFAYRVGADDHMVPLLERCSVTQTSGSKMATLVFAPKPEWGDVQGNTVDSRVTMGKSATTFDTGFVNTAYAPFNVTQPPVSVEATAVGLGWFTGVDEDADGDFDNFADTGDGGRCVVNLDWNPVQGAATYDVQISDGASYRTVESVPATSAPRWTSAGKGLYPADSTIATLGVSPGWGGPFLQGDGLELRDRPTALYRRVTHVGDDREAYEFRVVAHLASGAKLNGLVQVTPPSRSVDANNLPCSAVTAGDEDDPRDLRPVLVFVSGFTNRQQEFAGQNRANDEGQGISVIPGLSSGDDGMWDDVIEVLRDDYHIIKVPVQWNSADPMVGVPGGDIATNGARMYTYLREHTLLDPNRPYIIISYSMGGLVSRAMLDGPASSSPYAIQFRNRCKRVLQVGTPNLGTPYLQKTALAIWGLMLSYGPFSTEFLVRNLIAESQMRPNAMRDQFNKRYQNKTLRTDGVAVSGVRYYDKYAGRAMKKNIFGDWEWLGGDRVVERASVYGPEFLAKYGGEVQLDFGVHTDKHKARVLGFNPYPGTSSITIDDGDPNADKYLAQLVRNVDWVAGFTRDEPVYVLDAGGLNQASLQLDRALASKEVTAVELGAGSPVEFTAELTGPVEIVGSLSDPPIVEVEDSTGATLAVSVAETDAATGEALSSVLRVSVTDPGLHTFRVANETSETVIIGYVDPDAPGLAHSVSPSAVNPGGSVIVTASVAGTMGPVASGWRLACALGDASVPMMDDGQGPDATNGDGVFAVAIAAPAVDGRHELTVSAMTESSASTAPAALVSTSFVHVLNNVPVVGIAGAPQLGPLDHDGYADVVYVDVPVRNPYSVAATASLDLEVSSVASSALTATLHSAEFVLGPGEERTVRVEGAVQDIYPLVTSESTLRAESAHLAMQHENESVWVPTAGAAVGTNLLLDKRQLGYRSMELTAAGGSPGEVQLSGWAFTTRDGIRAIDYSLDGGQTWTAAVPSAAVFDAATERFLAKFSVPDGAYEIVVRPIDASGPWLEHEWGRLSIMEDGTPPVVLDASVTDAGVVQAMAFDGTSSGASGIDYVEMRVDGISVERVQASDPRLGEAAGGSLSSGLHTVELRAIDRQGNTSEWTSRTVVVP